MRLGPGALPPYLMEPGAWPAGPSPMLIELDGPPPELPPPPPAGPDPAEGLPLPGLQLEHPPPSSHGVFYDLRVRDLGISTRMKFAVDCVIRHGDFVAMVTADLDLEGFRLGVHRTTDNASPAPYYSPKRFTCQTIEFSKHCRIDAAMLV